MRAWYLAAFLGLYAHSVGATDYILTDVLIFNPFAPAGSSFCSTGVHGDGSPAVPCAGLASSDGLNVSTSGVQWDSNQTATADFIYSDGEWETTVGEGVTLTKLGESCSELSGALCSNLLGTWQSGSPTLFNDVTVIEGGGILTIVRTEEFAIPALTNVEIYQFSVIPLPSAVWLFVSALVLLRCAGRVT